MYSHVQGCTHMYKEHINEVHPIMNEGGFVRHQGRFVLGGFCPVESGGFCPKGVLSWNHFIPGINFVRDV